MALVGAAGPDEMLVSGAVVATVIGIAGDGAETLPAVSVALAV